MKSINYSSIRLSSSLFSKKQVTGAIIFKYQYSVLIYVWKSLKYSRASVR